MAEADILAHEQFVSAMEAKFSAADAAAIDAEDGVTDSGSSAVAIAASTDDEGDAEHTAPGTSDKPDGAKSESGGESADDDDDEHTDDADDAADDSADGDTATKDGDVEAKQEDDEKEEDPETAIAEDTKALLAARGADLKLDDVPQEFRPLIERKLRGIDQAFTRTMQEATTFRAERALFQAEQAFQAQHPELMIADLLRKHPELEGKVIEAGPDVDDEASMSAFDKRVADTRQATKQAVEQAAKEAHEAMVEAHHRADDRVATALRLSAAAGIEFGLVEPALILAVRAKPEGEQDLTDEEMATVIARAASLLKKPVRKALREQSRDKVKQRTERRIATAVPARDGTTPSQPATPAPKKAPEVDFSDEDSRRNRMMQTAIRIKPGQK